LITPNFFGLLRKQLVTACGLPEARNITGYLGYASGYQAALAMRELYATEPKETLWQVWARLYAQQGFAAVKPLSSTFDEKTQYFAAEAEFVNSCEVEQHLLHLGPSDRSVCWALTTYATGFASAMMGREVIFLEKECVGGAKTLKVDVRVLAATNQPLQKLVDEGEFRADLFYRLNVFPLSLPPLRERGNDLILLVTLRAEIPRALSQADHFGQPVFARSSQALPLAGQCARTGTHRRTRRVALRRRSADD